MSIITNTMQWVNLEAKRNKRNKLMVLSDMVFNYIFYDVFPQEYYHYGFYKKSHKNKKTYFTTRLYVKRRKQISAPEYENVIFLDKYIFAKVFHDFYGRKCMLVTKDTDKSEIIEFLQQTKKVVYKPLEECEGRGICSYDVKNFNSVEALCDEIVTKSKGNVILDEWLEQSEEMNAFYPKGVNCIRVYTFLHNGHFEFIDAKVSFGTTSDIVNATINGNLFATVDVQSGVITSDLTDYTLVLHEKHPVTGFVAKGTQLPEWDKVLELAKKAAHVVPQVAYVGWDIALTTKGPVLIEGNHCGGCGGNQFCTLSEKDVGTKDAWDVMSRI